eukprot:TRINITY_DN4350_c0_g5_i2.p1 TRINITY_DN4350_c0_g5~~TRINITY_DN4350_c0_g5_i2.p1  ORF type:complete len:1351 (+),score=201.20 TRINITY_DN4350_c0_g5_i2:75-4127(+)
MLPQPPAAPPEAFALGRSGVRKLREAIRRVKAANQAQAIANKLVAHFTQLSEQRRRERARAEQEAILQEHMSPLPTRVPAPAPELPPRLLRSASFDAAADELWSLLPRLKRGIEKHTYLSVFWHVVGLRGGEGDDWDPEDRDILDGLVEAMSPRGVARMLSDDWEHDAGGASYLTRHGFFAALYDLATVLQDDLRGEARLPEIVRAITDRVRRNPPQHPPRAAWRWATPHGQRELIWRVCPGSATALLESAFLNDHRTECSIPGLRIRASGTTAHQDAVVNFAAMTVHFGPKQFILVRREVRWNPNQQGEPMHLSPTQAQTERRRATLAIPKQTASPWSGSSGGSPISPVSQESSPSRRVGRSKSLGGVIPSATTPTGARRRSAGRRASLVESPHLGRPTSTAGAAAAAAAALCSAAAGVVDEPDLFYDLAPITFESDFHSNSIFWDDSLRDEVGDWATAIAGRADKVHFVVGQESFTIPAADAKRYPGSVFAQLVPDASRDAACTARFHRSADLVPIVITHLRDGAPPPPDAAPPERLLAEWSFWRLPVHTLYPADVVKDMVARVMLPTGEEDDLPLNCLLRHHESLWGDQALRALLAAAGAAGGWPHYVTEREAADAERSKVQAMQPSPQPLLCLLPPKGGLLACKAAVAFYKSGDEACRVCSATRSVALDPGDPAAYRAEHRQRMMFSQLKNMYLLPMVDEGRHNLDGQLSSHLAAWVEAMGLNAEQVEQFRQLPPEAQNALAWRAAPSGTARQWAKGKQEEPPSPTIRKRAASEGTTLRVHPEKRSSLFFTPGVNDTRKRSEESESDSSSDDADAAPTRRRASTKALAMMPCQSRAVRARPRGVQRRATIGTRVIVPAPSEAVRRLVRRSSAQAGPAAAPPAPAEQPRPLPPLTAEPRGPAARAAEAAPPPPSAPAEVPPPTSQRPSSAAPPRTSQRPSSAAPRSAATLSPAADEENDTPVADRAPAAAEPVEEAASAEGAAESIAEGPAGAPRGWRQGWLMDNCVDAAEPRRPTIRVPVLLGCLVGAAGDKGSSPYTTPARSPLERSAHFPDPTPATQPVQPEKHPTPVSPWLSSHAQPDPSDEKGTPTEQGTPTTPGEATPPPPPSVPQPVDIIALCCASAAITACAALLGGMQGRKGPDASPLQVPESQLSPPNLSIASTQPVTGGALLAPWMWDGDTDHAALIAAMSPPGSPTPVSPPRGHRRLCRVPPRLQYTLGYDIFTLTELRAPAAERLLPPQPEGTAESLPPLIADLPLSPRKGAPRKPLSLRVAPPPEEHAPPPHTLEDVLFLNPQEKRAPPARRQRASVGLCVGAMWAPGDVYDPFNSPSKRRVRSGPLQGLPRG